MASLVCGADCAPFTWDFARVHILTGLGLWCLLLVSSFGCFLYSFSANLEHLQTNVTVWRRRLQYNVFFVALHMSLATLQGVLYCVRTVSRSVGSVDFGLELAALAVYLVDFGLGWFEQSLLGVGRGTRFMCTWGLVDCLLVPSVLLMAAPVEGPYKSWGSFSFLAFVHLFQSWQWLFLSLRVNLQIVRWRIVSLLGSAITLIVFASLAMMTLENLQDPQYLLSRLDTSEWNVVASLYFVITSAATVGYGDLAPVTMIGRCGASVAVIGGMAVMVANVRQVMTTVTIYGSGGGSFRPGIRTKPIIISGNPTASMVKDFIAEIFHEDHADDAEDLHLIFFFPSGGREMEEVIRFRGLKSNIQIAHKISVFKGSVLDIHHLERVCALKAVAFIILPNMDCSSPFQEDAENIIRMLAVKRIIPDSRIILLLLKAESREILADAGINTDVADKDLTIVAADQFKLELVGKSVDVLGFGPFICNLCKSVGEGDGDEGKPTWLREYEQGVGNELYEIELSTVYSDKRKALFGEVVLDVLEQNGGTVYLIGIVEQSVRDGGKQILVNPGPRYPIKPVTSGFKTFGIFIAADRESVQQCEVNMVFLGRRERPRGEMGPRKAAEAEAERTRKLPAPPSKANLELARVAGPALQLRARQLVSLAQVHSHGQQPTRPPLKMLAQGGHILLMCIGAQGEKDFRLGAQHFVRPLRQAKDRKDMVPVVVMSPLVPRDWETVCDQPAVYFFKGSPLSQPDLERANFRAAAAIFICNVSNGCSQMRKAESWMVDSEMICCSRMVEAQLAPGARTLVVADLKNDANHLFLTVPQTSNTGGTDHTISEVPSNAKIYVEGDGEQGEKKRPRRSFTDHQNQHEAPESDGVSAAKPVSNPYFLEPRFASGQMFIGSVVTSLVVNTYYNPSLSELVSSMISSIVTTKQVPFDWVGKSYFEYFDHLLAVEGSLAVGILRRADPSQIDSMSSAGSAMLSESARQMRASGGGGAESSSGLKRRFAFVYTAPPAKETTMTESDRIICFGVSQSVTRGAAKA